MAAGLGWAARRLFAVNSPAIDKKNNAADRPSPVDHRPQEVMQRARCGQGPGNTPIVQTNNCRIMIFLLWPLFLLAAPIGWHPSSGAEKQGLRLRFGGKNTHRKGVGLSHNPLKTAGGGFESPMPRTTRSTVSGAVQSNMVYLPRINSSPCACFVARQINADC